MDNYLSKNSRNPYKIVQGAGSMAVKGKKTLKMGGSLDQNKHWG